MTGDWPAQDVPGPLNAASHRLFDFGHAYDPGRLAPRPARTLRTKRRLASRFLIALAVVAISGAATFAANRTGTFDRDRLATMLGFGIEQVSLSGHQFTPDSDLFDALDLKSVRSLASFDPQAIRTRFERLPWIESVEISRIWPGQLAIRVAERKPFAIWERGDTAELVDVTGRQLGPVKRDAALDLPRIRGDGANTTAAQLFTAIGRYPAIRSRLVRADRLGDRRWTLELAGGVQLHLPSDGENAALARFAAEPRLAALLDVPGQIIDLRSQTKIAIRAPSPGGEVSRR